MKYKTILLTLVGASFVTVSAFAQSGDDMTQAQRDRKDSVEAATHREAQLQNRKDENKMADAKLDRKETKAKAKEAQRVEKEANEAAHESKNALKAERKAQKSRKQADKQAKKASDARDKSNKN
jgi:hypothetical protein